MAERPWAVVVRPDATNVVRALGPIYSREAAERVVEAIERLESEYESALWRSGGSGGLTWLPQAVELENVAEFKRELAAAIEEENNRV